MSNKLDDRKRKNIAKRSGIKSMRKAVLTRRKLVRIIIIIIIIILCFETAPGNKYYLSVEQNINFLFQLTSFGI